MKLILIRHGETTGDIEDRYGGTYDDALSTAGEQQAKGLANALMGKGIEKVYTSSLIRAQQTGAALAATLKCPTETVADLRERNQYAAFSGMVKAEAKRLHPDLVEALKDRHFTMEGGESYEAFRDRITNTFNALSATPHACLAAVWHGGCMRVLFRDILKTGELSEIGNCSWVELERDNGQWVVKASDGIIFSN